MTVYHVQELPSIDDPHLVRNCMCVQDMRSTLTAFFEHVLSQLVSHHVTTSLRVTLAIVNRTAEQALSIELLCQKNRARDAAIILLSLHELRLDLQYIALDLDRAKIWIAHIQENKKPWRVSDQMQEIYVKQNERDAERWLYRKYSMVKHSNPAGENFAFGIAAHRHSLQLDCNNNSATVYAHLFGLGNHLRCVAAAAARILDNESIDVDGYVDQINGQLKILSNYNEEHIRSVLLGL